MEKKPVGVIILNWNGAALLRRFLPSVLRHTDATLADVIVADNGSTDASRDVLEREFPAVKRLYFDRNYGFAEGYNRAIKALDYEYSVLLNSDVEADSDWVRPLYDYMQSHPQTAACQPKLLAIEGRRFEYAGASGGFLDKHGYAYCRGRIFGTTEDDHGQYDDPAEVFWATGAALFVRTAVYLSAGGLDASFFAHMEEIDLCWRIHQAGYRVAVVPSSHVFHLGGGSLPASNPRKTYLNFRNNLLMLYKNTPVAEGRRLLFVRRLYDTLAFGMFVATLDFANARAVLKAHRDFRRMRRQYDGQQPAALSDEVRKFKCFKVNIIKAYYLQGIRHYSDLLPTVKKHPHNLHRR